MGVLEAGRNPKDDFVRVKKMPTVGKFAVEYMDFVSKYSVPRIQDSGLSCSLS
jgi:hypothetical protein